MVRILIKKKKVFISLVLSLAVLVNLLPPKILAQEEMIGIGFFPEYPTRLKYIAEELSQASRDLTYLNRELRNKTNNCGCQNTLSQCGQGSDGNIRIYAPNVFGDPCPNREELEQVKTEVINKTDQIYFLEELLKQEIAAGLEAELKTLREDEAEALRTGLNDLINQSEEISASALKNVQILNDSDYSVENQCEARCGTGNIFELQACLFNSAGNQEPIQMEFRVGARLTDLDLGEVRIDEIELNLPSRIEITGIKSVGDFTINLNDVTIDFPSLPAGDLSGLNLEPVVLHPPAPDIPVVSPVDFSCANFNASLHQCQREREPSGSYIDLEWYLQTFSWLSGKCNDLPTMKDENGLPKEEIGQCLDKEIVHSTIVRDCDLLWQQYSQCLTNPSAVCTPPVGICGEINSPALRSAAVQRECQDLFREENESIPDLCNLNALKNKCSELKEKGRETVPESCKFLPLFTGEIETPGEGNYELSGENCSPQIISDIPESAIRLDCPSLPAIGSATLPKIELPDIIIPDIRLPDFEFMPFVSVNLPDFIFEDLIFPDLNLCDFDACLPSLEPMKIDVQYPSLLIPTIEIPPLYISLADIFGIGGAGLNPLAIRMDNIDFPPIPFGLSGFDLNNYISFNLDLPEISLPEPKIILEFNGIKVNAFNILLGLVSNIIPVPSGCVGIIGGISYIPLTIGFPDYYFYWPKFPEIPNLCNNEYINLDSFCQMAGSSLIRDLTDKINRIESIINQTIQTQLQNRLDNLALIFEQVIRENISDELERIKNQIEQAIKDSVALATVENGMLEIPTAIAPLEGINILMDQVNQEISKIPLIVNLTWPANLRRIPLTRPITYQLPTLPLSKIGFSKTLTINLPGFQAPNLDISFGIKYPSCESNAPSGGNPYPVGQINNNLQEITNFNQSINNISNGIKDILY